MPRCRHIIGFAVAIIALGCLLTYTFRSKSQTIMLDYPFDQVVEYFNNSFKTNVTSQSSCWAWGPSFLSTNTVYFIRAEQYVPHRLLIFEAWFAQIGAESNTFIIQKHERDKTSISVDRRVRFFPIPTRKSEKRILRIIRDELSEQHGASVMVQRDSVVEKQAENDLKSGDDERFDEQER